ncbi:hypothetical protein CLV63_15510 [Murinocardiopsis flavida]|uniref:Acetone carboxylase gamma subunit n=1 Tax=Murinocardiopsis flavida TaxID=645275 RepID=A0A2P8C667_9ACTN|nr:hypothetical protein [Murinocardiopsis flavida]PSK80462.1 hypothetical protein CLV63_15510 [Murinocardiopsis flavida]
MPYRRQIRTRAECDGCGDQWLGALDIDYEPLFATRAQARRLLADQFGWSITFEGMWCSQCAARRECDLVGHIWETDADDGPDTWVYGEPLPVSRFCDRCGEHLPLDIADGTHHPEHVPGLLSEDDHALLAELEAAFGSGPGGPS